MLLGFSCSFTHQVVLHLTINILLQYKVYFAKVWKLYEDWFEKLDFYSKDGIDICTQLKKKIHIPVICTVFWLTEPLGKTIVKFVLLVLQLAPSIHNRFYYYIIESQLTNSESGIFPPLIWILTNRLVDSTVYTSAWP